MQRLSSCGLFTLIALLPLASLAAQKITLKSGTVLVGEVKMDGDGVIIEIDGSQLRSSFAEIVSIVPEGSGDSVGAQRLLLRSLESTVLRGAKNQDPELLAEAYRLAPQDPQIAFWYAFALESSGEGIAAEAVISGHQQAIEQAYPGAAGRLVKRINRRVELEKLPQRLVKTLDRYNELAKTEDSKNSNHVYEYALFQLVDQHDAPIRKEEFQLNVSGNNRELLDFPEGYYLHRYQRYRNNQSRVQLQITALGLEPKSFSVSGSSFEVRDLGKLSVKRYAEEEKRAVEIWLLDGKGEPAANASLRIAAYNQRGSYASQQLQASENGLVEALLFPAQYNLSASGHRLNSISKRITITKAKKGEDKPFGPIEFKLHRSKSARLRVAWWSEDIKGSGEVIKGEKVVNVVNGSIRNDRQSPGWFRAFQVGDQLGCVIAPTNGTLQPNDSPPWVRECEKTMVDIRQQFRELDLQQLTDNQPGWKPAKEIKPASTSHSSHNSGPSFQVEKEGLYVGELAYQDHRANRRLKTKFKLYVEQLD